MKKVIIYHTIRSGHPLAVPEETHREIVDVSSEASLKKYIESKTDGYGHPFKRKARLGFDYISKAGGVRVKNYKPPKIKKI